MSNLKAVIESIDDNEFQGLVRAGDYPAIAKYLTNRKLIDNPDPPEQVPAPIELTSLLAILQPVETARILGISDCNQWIKGILEESITTVDPEQKEAGQALATQILGYLIADGVANGKLAMVEVVSELGKLSTPENRQALSSFVQLITLMGIVSSATAEALARAMTATIEDPDYDSMIRGESIAATNGLGVVTSWHVQGALN